MSEPSTPDDEQPEDALREHAEDSEGGSIDTNADGDILREHTEDPAEG